MTDWQDIAALLSVVLAGAYVVRIAWLRLATKPVGRCGGCSSCATGKNASDLPLVKIDSAE